MSSEELVRISTEELREIVSDEMNSCLSKLGIDTDNWTEHQKDNAYIRKARIASDKIGTAVIRTSAGLLITGILSMVFLGVKSYFNQG